MKVKVIEIKNLFCMICEDKVSSIMDQILGVMEHKTNVYTKEIYMKYDPKIVKYEEILKLLNEKGFLTKDPNKLLRKDLMMLFFFIIFKIQVMFYDQNDLILIISSFFQFFNLKELAKLQGFTKNFLVLISSMLCYILGIWLYLSEEYTVTSYEYLNLSINIITYLLISSMILNFIVEISKVNLYSISRIKKNFVKKLFVKEDKSVEFQVVALEKLVVGDIISQDEGCVYVDGKIIKGECLADESDILGEETLRQKKAGDLILSSTRIIKGRILLQVENVGKNSYTGKILSLIEDSSFKSIFCKNSRSFLFTTLVLCTSSFVSLIYYLKNPDNESWTNVFKIFITTLLSLCPCVFIISEPLIALKARKHLLSKNIIVNNYSKIFTSHPKIVFLDKTGTLTKGYSDVLDYKIYHEPTKSNSDLNKPTKSNLDAHIIMQMEKKFQNTVYGSIYRLVKDLIINCNQDFKEIGEVTFCSGKGLRCFYENVEIRLGCKSFVTNSEVFPKLSKYYKKEKIVYYSKDLKVKGYFILSDNVKTSACNFVKDLKQDYSKVILISGDQKANVQRISETFDIQDYFYEQTSKDKLHTILNYTKNGSSCVMIGDGTNDIPAFRAANLSISVNLNNTSADVIILSDDLNEVMIALRYFKKMYYKNLGNYYFAVIYNITLIIWLLQKKEDSMDISCVSMFIPLSLISLNSLFF